MGKSQTWYIFIRDGAPISWKSVKQTVTAMPTNHAELLAFHEAAREAVWLRIMEGIVMNQCRIQVQDKPTVNYEDNALCVDKCNLDSLRQIEQNISVHTSSCSHKI